MAEAKKIRLPAKASMFYTLSIIASRAIGILTTPLLTRAMSATEYGGYSYYISILSIASMISGVFLTPAVFFTGLGRFSENKRGFANAGILIGTSVNLLICIVLFAFSDIFSIERHLPLIIFIQIFFDTIVAAELLVDKFSYSYRRVVIINLSSASLGALISIFLVFALDMGAMGRILGLLFSGAAISFYLVLTQRERGRADRAELIFLLKSALPLIPAVISRASAGFSDKLMIKAFIGADALAKYSVAHTVGTAVLSLIAALTSALNPWMIRKLHQGKFSEITSVVRELSALISWGSAMLIALAPEIFSFLAPRSYSDAVYVIFPLAISALPYFLFSISSAMAGFEGNTGLISAATIAGAAISISANLFLLPRIGYIGGGVAYLASETLMCLISSRFIRKRRAETADMLNPRFETYFALALGGAFLLLYNVAYLRILLLIIPSVMIIKHGFACLDLAREK